MKIAAFTLAAIVAVAAPVGPARAGDGGAIAAGVLGGLAAGAIIGSATARPYGPPVVVQERVYVEPEPDMCIARREVWSDRYQAYVVRKVRVPC